MLQVQGHRTQVVASMRSQRKRCEEPAASIHESGQRTCFNEVAAETLRRTTSLAEDFAGSEVASMRSQRKRCEERPGRKSLPRQALYRRLRALATRAATGAALRPCIPFTMSNNPLN